MGVYIYTFRTANKRASLGGNPVQVYSFSFLCRAGDESPYWREGNRARLLRANMARASDLFDALKPQYVVTVEAGSNEWDGATVHSAPKSGVWYDTDNFAPTVGFLVKRAGASAYANGAKGWSIVTERRGEDVEKIAGNDFRRAYVETIDGGHVKRRAVYYVLNGTQYSVESINAWRGDAEKDYWGRVEQAKQDQAKREETARLRAESLNCAMI